MGVRGSECKIEYDDIEKTQRAEEDTRDRGRRVKSKPEARQGGEKEAQSQGRGGNKRH